MTIRETIEQFEGRLTRADQRLIQVLLAVPGEGAFLSSITLAERAGVHPTTAVRLAKKLGFSGYPELRAKLQEEIFVDNGAARMQRRLETMAGGSILQSLIASEIAALQAVPDQISQDQIEQAADTLIESEQIAVFGVGHASALADLFVRRLNRSGYSASGFHHIGWETPEKIMNMGPRGVLFAFAFRHVPESLPGLLEFVRGTGARSIVIGDAVGPMIRPRPDTLLAASRGARGESQSLTVPMAICNALILELSKRDDGRSVASLERLTKARAALALVSGKPVPDVPEPKSNRTQTKISKTRNLGE